MISFMKPFPLLLPHPVETIAPDGIILIPLHFFIFPLQPIIPGDGLFFIFLIPGVSIELDPQSKLTEVLLNK